MNVVGNASPHLREFQLESFGLVPERPLYKVQGITRAVPAIIVFSHWQNPYEFASPRKANSGTEIPPRVPSPAFLQIQPGLCHLHKPQAEYRVITFFRQSHTVGTVFLVLTGH